jgi:hypothetical protein
MPHVELLGPSVLSDFHARFRPRSLAEGTRILRATGCYLSSDARSLLVECVTVEGYLRQSFFLIATSVGEETMVRLLPRTSPEKTDGVKRCLVWIARWIQAVSAQNRIGRTNLEDFLKDDFPADALMP